ncbi:MAG: TonB-dependent receptor, partial [Bacteroidota bacterium]
RNFIEYRNLSGTLGLQYPLGERSTFRSNFGTAWRAPDVAELYRFGQHSFFIEYGLWRYTIDERFDFVSTSEGILDQTDREVPSEQGYKWINTYNLETDKLQLELTGYINYIQNYIYSKPAGLTRTPRGFFVYFIYDQTDALLWGFDASSQLTHSERFTSAIRGSFLWSKQITRDDFFAAQPPPQLSYDFTYSPKIKWLPEGQLRLSLDYTFEQFQHPRIISVEEFLFAGEQGISRFSNDALDFDLLPPPPAYLLTSLSWSNQWKKFDVRLEVRNLFNVSYRNYTDRLRYFADDLGRNFLVTFTYHI